MKYKLGSNISNAITGTSLFILLTGQALANDLVAYKTDFESKIFIQSFGETSSLPRQDAASLLAEAIMIQARSKEPVEDKAAFARFEQAARLGNADAQFMAALMILDNENINRSEDDAFTLLSKARDQGHKQAQFALDYALDDSFGIGC